MASYFFSDAPFFSFSDLQRFIDDASCGLPAIETPTTVVRSRERGTEERGLARQFQPRMDIRENPEQNLVTATLELPGLKKEDVNVEIQGNRLIISGEQKQEQDASDRDYVVKERRYGRFQRSLPVPPGLQPNDIKATMDNGILQVSFPKRTQEQMPQRITVA